MVNKKEKEFVIRCEHYDDEGYGYEMSSKNFLYLCECCNMNLAGEIMKQLAIEHFLPKLTEKETNKI